MTLLRQRSTVVWALLTAATCLSWRLGAGGHPAQVRETGVSVAVLAVAFAKIRLVGLYFMELKDAPLALRAIFEGYIVVVGGLVIGMYLAA
jgi:hypothetical protein